jgi:hypothetical protein
MHFAPRSIFLPVVRPLLLCGLIASLHACGGGGEADGNGGTEGGASPQPAITLSGAVLIDQAVRNALVCVDLNGNDACDAAEPSAAPTGSDGKYTLTYQPADAAASAAFNKAPVMARVTPESVDAAKPGSPAALKTFHLSAPAGKAAQINPLTTLVQTAVSRNIALDMAERVVARQLRLTVDKLYDYQGDRGADPVLRFYTALTAAQVVAQALELDADLEVLRSGAPAVPSQHLEFLDYRDAGNYVAYERKSDGVFPGNGYVRHFKTRAGKSNAVDITAEALYPSVTLTSRGWTRCNTYWPDLTTVGSPALNLLCNESTTFLTFLYRTLYIGGKPMDEAVNIVRAGIAALDERGIRHERSVEMDPAVLGSTRLPTDALAHAVVSVQMNRSPAFIASTAHDRFDFTTLELMIAARPASAVNLSTPASVLATTVGAAGAVDARHVLRVAFVDAATAQFYRCLSTAPASTDLGSCSAHSQSAYSISTVKGVRQLNFADFPGKAFAQGETRGYTEYDGNVFGFRQPAALADQGQAFSYSVRLNGAAWNAMKGVLGIH